MTTYKYEFRTIYHLTEQKLNEFGEKGLRVVQVQKVDDGESTVLLEETVYEDWDMNFED